MSEEDLFYFRPIHWLVQFTWNYKYYRSLLEYAESFGINPMEILVALLENVNTASPKVQKLLGEFDKDSKGEWFSTRQGLVEHYGKPENFEDLKNGGFGKLNFKYTFKTLLECPKEFDEYIIKIAEELISRKNPSVNFKQAVRDIVKFESMSRVDFYNFDLSKKFILEPEKYGTFNYDILSWKKDSCYGNLHDYAVKEPITYKFHLPQNQIEALHNNLNQFKNVNPNFTLRKMSEYMRISDLFYKVESEKSAMMMNVDTSQQFHTSQYAQ